ncbi:MAG: hypothetical protein JWQ48_2315 [Conexibacter sp.]|nr:hypothetical protein [Conexibacter sp.]
MCYDRRTRQRRDEEESRKLWEAFQRETGVPPEQREQEVRLQGDEREKAEEPQPAPAER